MATTATDTPTCGPAIVATGQLAVGLTMLGRVLNTRPGTKVRRELWTIPGCAEFFGIDVEDVHRAIAEAGIEVAMSVDGIAHLDGGNMHSVGKWLRDNGGADGGTD